MSLLKRKLILKIFQMLMLKKFWNWMENYPKKLFNYKSADDIFY